MSDLAVAPMDVPMDDTLTDTMAATLAPRLDWVTPEGFAFHLPLAGLPARCLALAVDEAVIVAALRIISTLLNALATWTPGLASAAGILATFAVSLLYAAALEWFWQGQTVGKRLLGLRVMDARGLPLTWPQVLMRNLLRVVDVLPAMYLAGGVSCLSTRHGQRIGDLVAGTVVARPGVAPAPELAPGAEQKYNSFRDYPHLALRLRNLATPREAALAQQALRRRDQLDPAPRADLYAALVAHFQARVPFPEAAIAALSDEQYLRNVLGVLLRGPR